MTKTEKNREEKKRRVIMPAGIRNKMVAAVSMLLVASIMMVSSTYAWFTLSTAPEVKGITTNVGANGNLEMMLLNGKSFNSTAEDLGVQSDIGDSYSKKDVEAANVTWGNLVDLSANVYGLTNAILNPAKLNIVKGTDGNSNTVNSTMLLAPSYGNDGRVIDVNTETYSGKWSNSAWVYADTKGENAFAGVRVLGTSSGVTKQLSAYRNALNAINSNSNTAKNAIATSLANNGQTLANILVQHIQDETAKFKRTDVETLKKLVDALQTANEAAGEAIKQAVLAYNLSSAAGSLSDDAVDSLVAAIKAAEVTGLIGVTFAKSDDGLAVAITMPTGAEAAVTQWNGNSTAIKTASDNLTALLADDAKTEYAYNEFGSIMNGLIDKTHTKVAGVTNPRKTDMDTIVQYYTDNQRIDIVMLDGSGIYANIANLVGDYTASGFKVKVTTSAITASVPVTMSTSVSPDGLVKGINTDKEPAASVGGAGTTTVLSDTYGYALDFGFRTNAAGSNLLLQTAQAQRVYSDATAANTQGEGSYMQFKSNNVTVFSVDELRALMSAMRVVFVETKIENNLPQYTVLGIAAADITKTTDEQDGDTTYSGGDAVGTDGLKAGLYLYNYTVGNDGAIALGEKKGDKSVLTNLDQNVAKKITAIVYIDGEIVDNTMVANAANSMTGSLNLQFSSDADLKPMENTNMRNGGEKAKDAPGVTHTKKADAGATYAYGGTEYTVKEGYTIYEGSDGQAYYQATGSETYILITADNFSTVLASTSTGG